MRKIKAIKSISKHRKRFFNLVLSGNYLVVFAIQKI